MGSRTGFLGPSVLAFAIFAAVLRAVRPKLLVHECTQTFDASIFSVLFPDYHCQSLLTHPADYGFPVKRTRLYSLLVRSDMKLLQPVSDIYRLYISPKIDCGAFFAANDEEAGWLIVLRPSLYGVWYHFVGEIACATCLPPYHQPYICYTGECLMKFHV